MVLSENLKNGLHFQSKNPEKGVENVLYLRKLKDRIVLHSIYSVEDASHFVKPVLKEVEFTYSDDYLKTFSTEQQEFSIQSFPDYREYELCCNSQMILHEIAHCKLHGVYRKMFLESKAISLLLCFQKSLIFSGNDCESCKFLTNKIEKEKILKAKSILMESINCPPTIPQLSLLIGINQCYLKKGFKELFGTTIYDFVQEQRMMKARLLLHSQQYSVSEVASQIGFSSQSSFSSAFKKFTGVFPSDIPPY